MLLYQRQPAFLLLVVLSGFFLAACGPKPLATSTAPGISVGFGADSCPIIEVQAGDQVTWTNQDNQELIVRHKPLEGNGQFDSGVLHPGESFAFTFMEPGSYNYECSADAAVRGTVTVKP